MKNELIIPLQQANDRLAVGGKAYALQKLLSAGFNVPAGFVISAHTPTPLSSSFQAQLLSHFSTLPTNLVAVRSSAVSEDGTRATWAGQLDTFLNVRRIDLLRRLKQCLSSAGSARAQAYAHQMSLPSSPVAVIIQQMIQSDVSGVAFSAHPVSGNHTQIVIEAGLGLGEAVVSGHITPDTYITDKATGEIIEQHLASQARKLIQGPYGETRWQDLGPEGKGQKLSPHQLQELSQTIAKLETFFGYPIDVEWALYRNRFYILQSRPITTL